MSDQVDLEIRKKIGNLLTNNPGLYLSKIAEILDIRISEIEYNLAFLIKNGSVVSKEIDGYRKYYTATNQGKLRDQKTTGIRDKIIDLVIKNPGLHLSKIAELLNMRISLAEYHLQYLEKNNLITAIKEDGGHYKRYYTIDNQIGSEDKTILSLLRQEIRLKIVIYLLMKSKRRHINLLHELDISSSTLSFHINKLVSSNIISVNTYGTEKGYIVNNKKKIIGILLKYGLHLVVEDFKDVWEDLSLRK